MFYYVYTLELTKAKVLLELGLETFVISKISYPDFFTFFTIIIIQNFLLCGEELTSGRKHFHINLKI